MQHLIGEKMTREKIKQTIKEIVADQFKEGNVEEISEDMSFVNDLNADSLDVVELVMELEDNFDLSIPEEEATKMLTVGEAINYIENRLSALT